MDIETTNIIKMISISCNNEYDYINISEIVIKQSLININININIIIRVNYYNYYLDRQGIYYKKSSMMTLDLETLEQLYYNNSFNAYNLIASNTKIIGKQLNKIIIFNEKLEILSEINSLLDYNIYNDNHILIKYKSKLSPDNKFIFLLKENSIEICDINMNKIDEIYNINIIYFNNCKITNDYRIIYWMDKINILQTSLHNNLIKYINSLLYNYLPIELINYVFKYMLI